MLLPFQCQYCNGYFCEEHRLPENHECVGLKLKKPISRYSNLRVKKQDGKPLEPPIIVERDFCPNCRSYRKQAITYGEKFEIFECLNCGFEWKVPQEVRKKKRKHATRMTRNVKAAVIFVVSLIIVGVVILSWTNFFAQIIMPHFVDTTQVEVGIFNLINEERASRGFPTLLEDEALTTIAFEWSKQLAETGNLTHGDFEARIAQIGYSKYQCGEIIAMYGGWTPSFGRKFVDMWLDSPGHYQVMMTPSSGYMGVGVCKGAQDFFAVVDFRFS